MTKKPLIEEAESLTGRNDLTEDEARQILSEYAEGMRVTFEELEKNDGFLKDLRKRAEEITAFLKELEAERPELQPYIDEELEKPEYEGRTLEGLTYEEFKRVIETARAVKEKRKPGKTTLQHTDTVDMTLDKLNSYVWALMKEDTHGQLTFDLSVNMAKKGSHEEAPVAFSINFEELEGENLKITKTLQPFDRRVYQACAALFGAGNTVISLSSIYRYMGFRGRGGGNDIEKIRLSIKKMMTAQITLDNDLEIQTNKKYKKFSYFGALLPVEMGELYDINGAITEAAIRILREPPLFTFARERQQITTIPLKLLQSPVSKTDANILLDDYLIERIKREKNKNNTKSCRILYSTLFKRLGIDGQTDKDRKQRQRTPIKVRNLLRYYASPEAGPFIRRYSEQKDGLTVYF